MACNAFSITLAVLATNNKQQFSFSIDKGCLDNDKPFFVLIFIFRDRPNETAQFQDRVSLKVTVGDANSDKAQKIIDRGLTNAQLTYMKGPLTNVVTALPATGGAPSADPKAQKAAEAILNSKPVLPA